MSAVGRELDPLEASSALADPGLPRLEVEEDIRRLFLLIVVTNMAHLIRALDIERAQDVCGSGGGAGGCHELGGGRP